MSISAEWNYYLCPKDAWDAMYEDCEKATSSIEYEQYIFKNDEVGQRFIKLFIKKAAQGIRTVLICDGFGSRSFRGSDLVKQFTDNGGEFYFYNPVRWYHFFTPWRWFPRTHRKTMLVDSDKLYVGGICMSKEMTHWRDTFIRVQGAAAHEGRETFDETERRLRKLPAVTSQTQVSKAHSPSFSYQPNHIYATVVQAIGNAKKSIHIANVFFIPNRYFITLLKQQRQKQVDIHLMFPEHSDNRYADWVRLSYMKEMLDSGIHVYHYQPTVLHCKTIAVDDDWASVGSVNMDLISFFHNREAHVVVTDKAAVAELKDQFTRDLKDCVVLTHETLSKYPAWKFAAGRLLRQFKRFF